MFRVYRGRRWMDTTRALYVGYIRFTAVISGVQGYGWTHTVGYIGSRVVAYIHRVQGYRCMHIYAYRVRYVGHIRFRAIVEREE